jgi:hypothetical protein
MATAAQQARYRARDSKKTVEVRLSAEALARLDKLVAKCGAVGRGEAIERLLLAQGKGEAPAWMLNEGVRLGREYLRVTGTGEAVLRDAEGWLYVIRRERRPDLNYGPRPPGRSG